MTTWLVQTNYVNEWENTYRELTKKAAQQLAELFDKTQPEYQHRVIREDKNNGK